MMGGDCREEASLLQANQIHSYLGLERLSFLVSVEMVRSLEET